MTDYRIVLTTAGSVDEAERIATVLVEAELAACVNIVSPITSVYRWKGAVQKEQEWLLLIKTTASAFDRCLEEDSRTAFLRSSGMHSDSHRSRQRRISELDRREREVSYAGAPHILLLDVWETTLSSRAN